MKKAFKKATTSILVLVLAAVMLFGVGTDAFGGSVEAAAYIKELTSVDTNYEDFIDSSVMYELPSTVKDDDTISVIVMLNTPALIDTYDAGGKLTFTEYVVSGEADELREEIRAELDRVSGELDGLGIEYTRGAEYETVLTGYELLIEAKDYKALCGVIGDGAKAVVGEVYKPAETQLVENKVNVYETGIFNSSSFGYDGEGIVVAVLDTGLDYTHDAFKADKLAGLNLGLTFSEVEALLGGTNAKGYVSGLLASDVYVSDKVPFAFDYADIDSDVYSIHNNHGTHVSGVIAGDDDVITGVAPKAQIVSMKIFSDTYDSARSSWILSALEDAVALGVDVINMSIGTACGFSRVSDEEAISGVYDRIKEKGISLVVAASNSFSSAYGSEKNGNLGLTSNPDTGTVGSPSTYEAALSIASINGTKTPYILFNNKIMYFTEATDAAAEEKSFFDELLGSEQSREYDYVLIPGVGRAADYTDIDIKGKIALVKRGTTTFEQKANAAKGAGAAGIIVYNNTSGEIRMNAGTTNIPICSISQDDGELLAAQKTGKITISKSQSSGPFMSDFSSWGPTPDLRIKPEITAHGGNILSAVTGNEYDRLSGTSMACPNMAGVVAVLRQYIIENYPEDEITYENGEINYPEVNAIINRLLMSTADIVYAKNGIPYAVRKQGAGLANLNACRDTTAFILTYAKGETVFSRDTAMDKTKIELGDDPAKSGVYSFTFSVYNFGNSALSYNISALVMTEGVSDTLTYKGETVVTEEGYVLGGASVSIDKVQGGTIDGKRLTVGAGATADVTVTVKLSDEDKKYLDRSFENGMYVEGFVTLESADGGVSLNAPYLAFYGDWTKAPLFDTDYFETNRDELDDSIQLLDKNLPDAYATRPIGGIESDYINYLGSYYFIQNPDDKIIAASREYVALSNYDGTVHSLRFVWAGLLRNAAKIEITITDAQTGEVVFTRVENDVRKSYGDGGSIYPANVEIEFDAAEHNLKNNTRYNVKLQGYVDYGDGGLTSNEKTTFEFPFTTDFSAPAITGVEYYTEYDSDEKKNRLFAKIAVYDNHYAMSMQVGYITKAPEGSEYENQIISFDHYLTPIYSEKNGTTYVEYELTDHIYDIKNKGVNKNTLAISVYDYALNIGVYEIPLPDEYIDFYVEEEYVTMNPYEVSKITPLIYPDTEWPELLTYTSNNENVVRVVNDKLVAIGSGKAGITVSDPNDPTKAVYIYVTVRSPGDEGYREVKPTSIVDNFKVVGYETLKAYYLLASEDQDIGEVGDVRSFAGDPYLEMFPSESVKLRLQLDEYFAGKTELTFTSGNDTFVSVDEDGVIVANAEGVANITVRLTLTVPDLDKDGNQRYDKNGKLITKTLASVSRSIRVSVKDPYIRSGPTLTNYYGNGDLVQIPTNLKITEIGQYAFSNYHYIPKEAHEITDDEPDTTKISFIGENTITKVIIPEGVEKIGPYAFANLTALESVELPSTLKYIEYGAFYGCTSLKSVKGLENVVTINKYAFQGCDLNGKLSLDSAHAIADYAFASLTVMYYDQNGNEKYVTYSNDFTSVTISETLRSIGAYAFRGNTSLTEVEIKAEKIKLGEYAFSGCNKLTSIDINASVIPAGAFYECRNLTGVKLGKDVAAIGEYAFTGTKAAITVDEANPYFKSAKDGDAIVKEENGVVTLVAVAPSVKGSFSLSGVHIVGQGAFAGNTGITEIDMPDVYAVESNAFADCTALKTVKLGSLRAIGSYAFFNTPITTLPTFDSQLDEIGAYAFAYTDITAVTVPAGMTVGEGAFCECQKLTSVYVGNGAVLKMGAFMLGRQSANYRTGATNWVLESKTDADGEKVYYYRYVSALITIEIGDGAVIGDSAFLGAASVINVKLGDGVSIGRMAFYNAQNLTYIDLSHTTFVGELAFSGDVLNTYSDPYLNDEIYDYERGDYVYSYHAPKLVTVDLSGSSLVKLDSFGNVIEDGKSAFQYCQNLTTVILGEGVTVIPDGAFADCPMLSSINLEKVQSIGEAAFSYTALTEIDLSSATFIDEYAFLYCEELTKVTFGTDGVSVGEGAFAYCDTLTELEGFNKVAHVGAYAFAYSAVTELDLSGAVSIGDLAFMKPSPSDELYDGAIHTIYVTLGDGLVSLGDNPFANCRLAPFSKELVSEWNGKQYTEITYTYDISESVKVIDGSLYTVLPAGLELSTYIPNGNTSVVLPEGVVRVSAMAFSATDVVRVTLPHSLNAIGHKAFYDCEALTTVIFKSFEAPVLEEEFDRNYFLAGSNFPDRSEYQAGDETFTGLEIVPYVMYITLDGNTNTFDFSTVYYGASFVDYIGHRAPSLVMVHPSNGKYYDSFVFDQYFAERVSGAVSADDNTIAAIEAIAALPDRVMLEHESLVIAARAAYARVLLEQQALVTNYSELLSAETRIQQLKNTKDEVPSEPTPTPPAAPTEPEKDNTALVIILICIVIVIAAAVTVYFVYIRGMKNEADGGENATDGDGDSEGENDTTDDGKDGTCDE